MAIIWVTVLVNHCSYSYLNLWDSLFNAARFGFFRKDLRPSEMRPKGLTQLVTFSKYTYRSKYNAYNHRVGFIRADRLILRPTEFDVS